MIAYKWFEKGITFALIIMMAVVLLLSTVDLAVTLFNDIVSQPIILDINELLDIFGLFMIVLIGIELLETIKAYLDEHIVHTEIVLEVAMIAIARKVIILDIKKEESLTLFRDCRHHPGPGGLLLFIKAHLSPPSGPAQNPAGEQNRLNRGSPAAIRRLIACQPDCHGKTCPESIRLP